MSKQNAKHIPGDWSKQKQLCTVCGYVMGTDTKAPVLEGLKNGESYTIEDDIDGNPGAYTFTVSDPAESGETSSGIKSVTINGVPQTGPIYRLPAPDGGNNDAGAEHTVVATDNAGNETTATVRTYRLHHVKVISPDGNGTASASPDKAVAGTEITLTATPKEDYRFKEWQVVSPAGLVITNNKFTMPDSNVEVKAIFEEDAPPAPTEFTITDQEFKAWEISGTEYKVGDTYTVSGDTEIKALWENSVITPTTYTVTVGNDGNGTGTASPSTAAAGTTITLTATPNKGYHFKEWEVISGGVTIKDDKFLMPNDNVEVRAIFEKDAPTEYTIIVTSGGNGTASASHAKAVVDTEIRLTATPKEGYHFKEWQVISGNVTIKDNKFTMPSANVEVKAIFEKDAPPAPTEFTITVKTDGNGTASASHAKAVVGTEIILTATPKTGYHFKEWQVISGGVTIENNKFTMPSANVEVKAIFEKDAPPAPTEFTITVTSGDNGTASASHAKAVVGTEITLTATPNKGYHFKEWQVISGGVTIKDDKFTMPSANVEVKAIFEKDTGGGGGGYNPPVTYYTLRFETGGGSDIPSVQGTYNTYIDLTKYVPTWRGHTFIGWYSERSLMNKVSGVYLTKDMTVYAGWRVDENPGTGANPFTDVSEKDWFYGDVMFVYENGLMLGTSKTLFSPYGTATRGMMATILWRMEGSPAPKGKNSFTDVEAGKWYADAITWTAENGIFAGYGKDKFGPDDPITREQLAAIFYRYADYKGYDLTVKGNLDKFKDADKITDYAKTAMQWAVGSSLVKGKSGNLLDPQGTATRAEIAAMLHRFIEKYELVQGKAPGGLMGWIDPKRLQIPKTGDSSVLGLWGISLCTSLAGCLALTTWQIRRRREEESLQIIEK